LVVGFARGLAWVAAQTFVTSIGTADERAAITGRFSFTANLGPFIGPILASFAAEVVGYQLGFIMPVLVGLVSLVVSLSLPNVHRRTGRPGSRSRERGLASMLHLLRVPGLQVAMLLTFARLWLVSGWAPFFQI